MLKCVQNEQEVTIAEERDHFELSKPDYLDPNRKREVKVFLSSTIKDMIRERKELTKKIFPQLKHFCQNRNVDFSYVELRWGITDEVIFTVITLLENSIASTHQSLILYRKQKALKCSKIAFTKSITHALILSEYWVNIMDGLKTQATLLTLFLKRTLPMYISFPLIIRTSFISRNWNIHINSIGFEVVSLDQSIQRSKHYRD